MADDTSAYGVRHELAALLDALLLDGAQRDALHARVNAVAVSNWQFGLAVGDHLAAGRLSPHSATKLRELTNRLASDSFVDGATLRDLPASVAA